jgi:hypothetical protein
MLNNPEASKGPLYWSLATPHGTFYFGGDPQLKRMCSGHPKKRLVGDLNRGLRVSNNPVW